jgi:hypothetical protein
LALLAAGRREDYRRLCARLLPDEGQHPEAGNPLRAWLYVLAPEGGADPAAVLRLAEKKAADKPNDTTAAAALEAALYRAGRSDDPRWGRSAVRAGAHFFRAMRYHRLGNAAEARKALEAAVRRAADVEADGATPWGERVELRLLREEAEKVVGPGKR